MCRDRAPVVRGAERSVQCQPSQRVQFTPGPCVTFRDNSAAPARALPATARVVLGAHDPLGGCVQEVGWISGRECALSEGPLPGARRLTGPQPSTHPAFSFQEDGPLSPLHQVLLPGSRSSRGPLRLQARPPHGSLLGAGAPESVRRIGSTPFVDLKAACAEPRWLCP